MTNKQIVLLKSLQLMRAGILEGSGVFATIEGENGLEEIELPEPIHTYATWKKLGFQVKKGEKAIADFTIWRRVSKKVKYKDENGKEQEDKNPYCIMKNAHWFKSSQVEKIER